MTQATVPPPHLTLSGADPRLPEWPQEQTPVDDPYAEVEIKAQLKPRAVWLRKRSESLSVMSDSSQPHGLYSPRNSPGQNSGVGSLSLLQGIFQTQGSNPGPLHCRWILYQLSHKESSMETTREDPYTEVKIKSQLKPRGTVA